MFLAPNSRTYRRPKAAVAFGAVLAALALTASTLFVLTSGFDTSTWVVTDNPRAALLGLDAKARQLAIDDSSTSVKAYMVKAADALQDEGRLIGMDDESVEFDVNEVYGIAFVDVNDGALCHQLIVGTVDKPGSVQKCVDTPDPTNPTLDELSPAVNYVFTPNGTTKLSARAWDNRRLEKVEFSIGAATMTGDEVVRLDHTKTKPGWSRTYEAEIENSNVCGGTVPLTATAWDKDGNVHSIQHDVVAPGPSTPSPSPVSPIATGGVQEVTVSWAPSGTPSAATGYYVHYNTVNDFATASSTARQPEPARSVVVGSLDSNKTYYFWMTLDGWAPYQCSPESGPVTGLTVPSTPTGLTAVGVSGSSTTMNVSWAALPPSFSGYKVYRDSGATPVFQGSATSFVDTGLTGNTSYNYTIVAFNSSGDSPLSAPATGLTAPHPPDVEATTVGTTATVTWTAPERAVTYDVQRDGSTIATDLTVLTLDDPGLTPGQTYTYKVRACDVNSICSSWSDPATTDTVPSPPTNLHFTYVSTSQMNLTWNNNPKADTYDYERSPSSYGPNPSGTTGASVSLVQTSLSSSRTYSYRVRGCNGSGCGAWSAWVANTTGGSQTFNASNSIHTWTLPAGITNGRILITGGEGNDGLVRLSGCGSRCNPGSGGKGGRLATNVALTPGGTYEFLPGGMGAHHTGGWPYGGAGDGGGGGTSVFRTVSSAQIVMAGGGGGGGSSYMLDTQGGNGGGGGSTSTSADSGGNANLCATGGARGHVGNGGGGGYAGGECWKFGFGYLYGSNGTNGSTYGIGQGGNGAIGDYQVAGGGGSGWGGGGGGGAISHPSYGQGVAAGAGGAPSDAYMAGSAGPAGIGGQYHSASQSGNGYVRICWHGSTSCSLNGTYAASTVP